ncbi:MerR family transcriptional regulator [Mycobacterium syngnathidarum]
MRIGELSSRSGVRVRSLRYYEEQGLLSSTRSAGNQRQYREDAVARVELIQWLYSAGLSSRTIREMLPCVDNPSQQNSAAALERMVIERDRLANNIANLCATQATLDDLIAESTRKHRHLFSSPDSIDVAHRGTVF